MSVWQLINASSIGILTRLQPVTHPLKVELKMRLLRFHTMRCDRMRCDAISIRFVYRKTNTWLFNISAKCVCVCVYVLAAVRYSWLAKWVVTFQNANVSSSWKQYACAVGSAPSSPTKSRLYPLAVAPCPYNRSAVCMPPKTAHVRKRNEILTSNST